MCYEHFRRCVVTPFWFGEPSDWVWVTPDGFTQGFALIREQVGLVNLLWLALDMTEPPVIYDARPVWEPLFGVDKKILERASFLTLEEFKMEKIC
jgi:hypothetical protein